MVWIVVGLSLLGFVNRADSEGSSPTTIPVNCTPSGVAVVPTNNYIYVACEGSVIEIDSARNAVVGRVTVNDLLPSFTDYLNPTGISNGMAYDPTNDRLFIADGNSGTVSVIDLRTNNVLSNISVGDSPFGAVYDSSNGCIYVVRSGGILGGASVSVIDGLTNVVIATITPEINLFRMYGLAYDSTNGYIYVTGSVFREGGELAGIVLVIDGSTNSFLNINIAVGTYFTVAPLVAAYNPTDNEIYVVSSAGGAYVIDGLTNTIVKSISVGGSGAAYDVSDNYLFVTSGGTSVSVIDCADDNVIETVGLPSGNLSGLSVSGIAYNPSNKNVYVTNPSSSSVNVIEGITTVSFKESGLPPELAWSVTLDGSTKSSTATSINFTVPNGSYSFTVESISGYSASPSSGSVVASGSATIKPIEFSSSTGGGGIPEFPVQLGMMFVATTVLVTSYVLTRRVRLPKP